MGTGIQDFYEVAQREDFARDFQFRIVTLPGSWGIVQELYPLYFETASVPGKAIFNQPTPFMGLSFNVPGAIGYSSSDAWTVHFRSDQAMKLRASFENAIQKIFDDETSSGDYSTPKRAQVISVDLIGKNFETVRSYDLIGAYPVSIGDMAFDIKGTGTPVGFDAVLAYQFWRAK